jgi:hypothetical protein
MRHRSVFALLPAGVFALLAWACASKNNPNLVVGTPDSGAVDAGDDGDASEDININGPDSANDPCSFDLPGQTGVTLDPVALCTQQQVLSFEIHHAYTTGKGVAPGWASTGTFAPLTGHAWQDDLGLAGAIGGYYCNAEVYGNNAITGLLSTTLADLGNVLSSELQQTPSPYAGVYDGELYFRLRWAQAAFNYANSNAGTVVQGLADAYGATLANQAFSVAPVAGDGGSPGGMVIGTKNADGTVTYSPAQAVMAAAALLDMAVLQLKNPDAGAQVASWTSTAQQVIAYVLARGRDPVTGLFYQSLTTSSAPGHDTVGPGTPTNDTMLTESQAWVMLGLARAQDLLDTLEPSSEDAGVGDGSISLPAYWDAGNALAASLAAAGLFDGSASPPSPPPPGAFMEGLVLSSSQLLTDKTTIGNAIMLGGFHRVATGQAGPQTYMLGEIRSAFTQITPVNTSFLSVVTDSNGNLVQQSYLRATSKDYGYAVAYSIGESAGTGLEQGATNYRSDAVHAMVEGLTQLWHGSTHDANCAP